MILQEHHIMIAPQPSWEGITFHNNVEDDECAQFLAKCGITLDEVDDCHDLTFTWIQENNTSEEKEMHLHILFSQTVAMADAQPTVELGTSLFYTGFMKPTRGGCQSCCHLGRRQATRMSLLQPLLKV